MQRLQSSSLAAKQRLLDEAGYIYNPDREIYLNRKTKKLFSVDFVEDHNEEELGQRIRQATDGKEWQFNFNSRPADSVKRELEIVLG